QRKVRTATPEAHCSQSASACSARRMAGSSARPVTKRRRHQASSAVKAAGGSPSAAVQARGSGGVPRETADDGVSISTVIPLRRVVQVGGYPFPDPLLTLVSAQRGGSRTTLM